MGFFEKYLSLFKLGAGVIAAVAILMLGIHIGKTDTALTNTTEQNKQLTQKLGDMGKFMTQYQSLVAERDALQMQNQQLQANNDKLTKEKQDANQNSTLQLISTLRDPANAGMYTGTADCGEAGNYPEVFGTIVGPSSGSTRH